MTEPRKNAVVLGASARNGTGWKICETLAAAGYNVCASARTEDGVKELSQLINGEYMSCDATVESEVENLARKAHGGAGFDIAILVAGEGVTGTIDAISQETLDHAITLNFYAPVYFLRHMARNIKSGGRMVFISSIAAHRPWPGVFSYGCSKAALETLVRYAALEYAPKGISVNAVAPGPILTPTTEPRLKDEKIGGRMVKEIPQGRFVTAQEVADAVVWLATKASSINGESILIDGGMHLRRALQPTDP